jgi:hypothetical protein
MHREETKAKISAALTGRIQSPETRARIGEATRQRWAAGEYDFLCKAKPSPQTLEHKREACRRAALRQWAEGRGSLAGILSPEARRKSGITSKTSPRARAHRAYVYKLRKARARAKAAPDSSIFDERKVSELILKWQHRPSEEGFRRIIDVSLNLIDSLIRRYSWTGASDFGDVRHDVVLKLAELLPKYDPARGRAFTFFTVSIKNFLFSRFDRTLRRRGREVLTDFTRLEENAAPVEEEEEERESARFLRRLRGLVDREGWSPWQPGWRWRKAGRIVLTAPKREWRWRRKGKIAA